MVLSGLNRLRVGAEVVFVEDARREKGLQASAVKAVSTRYTRIVV